MVAPDSKSWVRNLPLGANDKSLDPVTKYSFKDCIDHCDEYNMEGRVMLYRTTPTSHGHLIDGLATAS